jgi:phospholipase/carboxylesterase
MLHGVGADASGFQAIAEALAPALPHAEFLVPDGFHPFDGDATGRQWFSLRGATDENRAARVREGGREVSAWLDEELRRRGLGGDRLAVVGFSQGAMVAAWLALHRESHPAAVVLFSGLVAEDSSPTQTDVATPILLVHGERDARIPVASVEPSLRTLESFGARVDKRVYPGLGHAIDERALRDARAFLRGKLEPAQL